MSATLHIKIRRNSDGKVRTWSTNDWTPWLAPTEDSSGSEYMWEEGNYACDCNRAHFFGYAVGEPFVPGQYECGDNGYTVLSITQGDDPAILYAEDQ